MTSSVPLPPETESRTVVVDGTRIRYLVAGPESAASPPVVFLHGGGTDEATLSWRETIPALAATRRIYAPDWPGYGESDAPNVEFSIEYYVDVLDGFLDALDIDAPALVAISMGGGIGLGFALRFPERVARLALVDSYGLGGTVPGGSLGYLFVRIPFVSELITTLSGRSRRLAALSLRGIVGSSESVTPELVDELAAASRRPNASRAFRSFQRAEVGPMGLRTNYVDRLPDLSVPTLFVHGERDPLVPVEWAVRAGTLVSDADVRILPNCGHWPPRERPVRFNELLRRFLDA